MKVLRVILIVLLVIAAAIVILGFTGPKTLHVERDVSINAPQELVFPYLAEFSKTELWSPWAERDPEMETVIEGTDGAVGTVYRWSGNKDVGVGTQELTKVDPYTYVEGVLNFVEPYESSATYYMSLDEAGGRSKVAWGFDATNSFVERIIYNFMDVEGMIAKDYEKGLEKLKQMLESKLNGDYNGYQVQYVDFPGRKFLAHRAEVPMDAMQSFYEKHLPAIQRIIRRQGIETDGMPCGLYYTWNEQDQVTEMAAAIPVQGEVASDRDYKVVTLPPGKALLVDYYGSYDNLAKAYEGMDSFVEEFDLEAKSPVIEQYVTDPMTEPDPGKWLTKIWFLLEGA